MIVPGSANLLLAGADEGYQISRSLRFNSADSAYLNRTPAGAPTSAQKYTQSFWAKKSKLASYEFLYNCEPSDYSRVYFFTDDILYIDFRISASNTSLATARVFRDPSAWYHIVIAVDTTQATAANRVLLYVNGVQETLSGTYPALNGNTVTNSANAQRIGSSVGGSQYFNGYLTEVNFIDGQALTPSSFGETDSATGVWKPKKFSGTYGTNGFYLNFSDNSNTTAATLGKDYSGNGNNWTPNLFSVTAGTGNDSLVDTPTSYGVDTGVGGEVRGNYCTADVLTPQGSASGLITVANGNLQLSYTSSNYAQRFGNFRVNSGKWYYEWTVTNIGFPSLQCGWFSGQAYPTLTGATGQATGGSAIGYFSGSNLSVNTYSGGLFGSSISSQTWSNGDVIMVAVDFDAGKIWFGKNNSFYSSGNPASGTNPIDTWTASSSLNFAPWFVAYGTTTDTYVNFGQRPFAHTAPSGFKALCTQNLPTPTIGATSTTQANRYFDILLETGTGSARSVTGLNFQPDFLWAKGRNASSAHLLYDAVRGVDKSLNTNNNLAEDTTAGQLTSFNSNGYSLPNDTAGYLNFNGRTYAFWNWKANGAGSSNTAGTITSTVSANTTSGFSIVKYTGSSTGNDGTPGTVGHGLGIAPSLILFKPLDTYDGCAYHSGLTSASYRLVLFSSSGTLAEASDTGFFNGTPPTSTVFSVGTRKHSNSNGGMIAYCFAPVAGYSAFGKYTGNGDPNGPFVYTGFRPRFVLIKNSSASAAWYIYDTARDTYNVATLELNPNNAQEEENNLYGSMDITSNGFKLRFAGGEVNNNTNTFIYAAFAESPFKYSLAR